MGTDIISKFRAQFRINSSIKSIEILAYKEKEDWTLTAKYNIGSKRVTDDNSENEE